MNFESLTKSDLHALVDLLGDCAQARSADEFGTILKKATLLVPYELTICVTGDLRVGCMNVPIVQSLPDGCRLSHLCEAVHSPSTSNTHEPARTSHVCWEPRVTTCRAVCIRRTPCSVMGVQQVMNGSATYICLSGQDAPPDARHIELLDAFIPHLHLAILRVSREAFAVPAVNLSSREISVLQWAMSGKTNWEIAKILAVTEATVKFHLANSFRKLNAVNKSQAIARALSLNLIDDRA